MPKSVKKSGPSSEKHRDRPVHPYSRKAVKISKQFLHDKKVDASKSHHQAKLEITAERLRWFQDHIDDRHLYTRQDLVDLVTEYRNRFDEELEQISIVHGVGHRNAQTAQHASREAAIKHTMEEETNLFEGAGIEVPDLMNKKHLEAFKKWDGDPKYIQNLKLRKVSALDLKRLQDKSEKEESQNMDDAGDGVKE